MFSISLFNAISLKCHFSLLQNTAIYFSWFVLFRKSVFDRLLEREVVFMSEENSLIEIPRSDWTKLRDLYVHKDTDPQGYLCINNFIKWLEKDSDLKVTFLSLNGDWQNDGTFVLTVSNAIQI